MAFSKAFDNHLTHHSPLAICHSLQLRCHSPGFGQPFFQYRFERRTDEFRHEFRRGVVGTGALAL